MPLRVYGGVRFFAWIINIMGAMISRICCVMQISDDTNPAGKRITVKFPCYAERHAMVALWYKDCVQAVFLILKKIVADHQLKPMRFSIGEMVF